MITNHYPLRRLGRRRARAGRGAVAVRSTPALAAPSPGFTLPSVTFTQILPRQTFYSYDANPCPEKYFPDGPIRAFRRADGNFVVDNNENDDFQLVGSTPFDLRVSCPSILSSAQYGSLVRGQTGIEATYTEDGQTIYALAGQDLSALTEAIGCVDQGTGNCWQGDVEALVSTDMGNDFSFTSSGNGDVAALTHTLTTNQPSTEGYNGTSNIIKRSDGFYYLLTSVVDAYAAQSRTCLIRTNNLADPGSWRGYDGSGFNAVLQPTGNGPSPIPCANVGNGNLPAVSSLSFIPRKGIYIAVFQGALQLAGDSAPVSGAYYSTSVDLLNWTQIQRLMALPHFPGVDSLTESDNYPVLIDPFSQTRNFETIDSETPVLVYALEHLIDGRGRLDRDLVAVPFRMQ